MSDYQWRLVPKKDSEHTAPYNEYGSCAICGSLVDMEQGWEEHDAVPLGSVEDTVWRLGGQQYE